MSENAHSNRRTFLTASGGGSAALLAGCVGPLSSSEENGDADGDNEEEDDGLPPAEETDIDTIAADSTDVPPPVDWDEPRRHEIALETTERIAEVEPGVTHRFMTFNDQVPGPFIRVRRGDTIHLTFDVPEDLNADIHNVDFHATYSAV